MAAPVSVPLTAAPDQTAIPPALFNVCFVLFVINATFFPTAWFSHWWIYDANGLGIPTDLDRFHENLRYREPILAASRSAGR